MSDSRRAARRIAPFCTQEFSDRRKDREQLIRFAFARAWNGSRVDAANRPGIADGVAGVPGGE
jgi:hypothetical protein